VRIGERALIGAGAVVVHDVPPDCVAFGNPAVVRCKVGELVAIEKRVDAVANAAGRHRRAAPFGVRPLTADQDWP
jgi:serine acetyltransferase